MERQVADRTQQIEKLRVDLESRPTTAKYDELRQLIGTKASESALEQFSLQSEIVCSKLESKADVVRVRTLEEQHMSLSSTMANQSEVLALQRQVRFLEDRLDRAAGETHGLLSKLQAASTVQKDALQAVEQQCVQLAEEVSRNKVQSTVSALIAKVDGTSELCNRLVSSLELKADKVNIQSWTLRLGALEVNLAKKADQTDHDRMSLLLNGLQEGMLSTIQQKVEKELHAEGEKLEALRAKFLSQVEQAVADLHEKVEKRLEEFRSAVASGVFCAGWAESFGQAWLSKVERMETTVDGLNSKLAELAVKQPEDTGLKGQLEDIGRRLAGKAEQSALDVLQTECSRKADKAEVADHNKLVLESARWADKLSLECSSKAEKVDHNKLSLECASKADAARVAALEDALRADVARLHAFESAHKVDALESTNKVQEMLATLASHADQLKGAELTRFAFANVIELLGVRFMPDHERVVELIRGRVVYGDANELASTFVGTLSPNARSPPSFASQEGLSDPTMYWPAGTVRVGGGFRYLDGQRAGGSRPGSASRRGSEAARASRLSQMREFRYP